MATEDVIIPIPDGWNEALRQAIIEKFWAEYPDRLARAIIAVEDLVEDVRRNGD